MKIAFINIYQKKVYRGAETFVSEVAKRLSKYHEVDVLTSVLPLLRKKYDVVIPTNGRFQVFFVRLISWATQAKMIVSGQSGVGLDDRINLYSFPDVFIGLTDYQTQWAKIINPLVKSVKIPNGVDLTVFKPGKKEKVPTILSVGAFTKEKGHDLTIRAVEKLPNVKLIIVGGGGAQKGNIKFLGEKTLGSRFEILTLPHNKMPKIYREASVFAFPTVRWESFGIAMVEAMASGLPVVATDDPIRREIVGPAGILVDPTNADSFSQALDKALDKKWDNIPRKQAENFSWDEIAERYENLFKDIK